MERNLIISHLFTLTRLFNYSLHIAFRERKRWIEFVELAVGWRTHEMREAWWSGAAAVSAVSLLKTDDVDSSIVTRTTDYISA
jgi:hypothetical protein